MANGDSTADGAGTPSSKPWYRDLRALIAFGTSIVILITGVVVLVGHLNKGDRPARVSAAYIVDVSKGMAGAIGEKRKLPAVIAEVLSSVRNTPSLSTALRLTGPSCSGGYSKPDVDFDEGNGDNFSAALEGLNPAGESDFANTVSHAVDDFISRKDAASSVSKSLFIFVGGPDTCSSRPVEVIRDALQNLRSNDDVDLNLKFVGVKPSPEVKELLREVRQQAKRFGYNSDVVIANRPQDLDDVLPSPCRPGETRYFDPADDQYHDC